MRIRTQFADRAVLHDPHRLEHTDVTARRVERLDARLVDRGDERRGAAVADRRFRTVQLDHDIVDAEPAQRGEHMLGGRAERAKAVAQHRGKFSGGNGASIGADFALRMIGGGGAKKNDAGVGIGGMKRQSC